MVNYTSDNDVLLHRVKELGIDISIEEIDTIVSEVNEKYETVHDLNKMHPLTRAFINLTKKENKHNRVNFQTT